jgi:hypothetical protein
LGERLASIDRDERSDDGVRYLLNRHALPGVYWVRMVWLLLVWA